MSQSDSMGGLILTHSQELTLFNDHEVDSMMTLLEPHLQPQPQLYYEQETYQLVEEQETYKLVEEQETYKLAEDRKPFQGQLLSPEETNGQNDIINFPEISDLSPTLLPIPPAVISNEQYAGPFNFEVYINPHLCPKNPWVFSSVLNKLYITMSNPFPVDFKWDPQPTNLYVRATPLFSLAQHVHELVTRCIPHSLANDISNRNVSQTLLDHILRCQSRNAHYFGNKDKKYHLNVLVPLGTPQSGMESVRLMYSFVCKNSCPSGMNRRPFEVVFTLEDETGNVYGRKKINVRVCSCPKRDKEKEEKDHQKEGTDGGPPPGKKRKAEKNDKKPPSFTNDAPRDTKEYLLQISVCGKHIKEKVMRYAFDAMSGELVENGSSDNLQKCLNTLGEQLKHLD